MLTALRGGLGFLTQIPVGQSSDAWDAFRRTPTAFPLVGYAVGLLAGLPMALGPPPALAGVLFPAWLYLVTGINHVDGLADLGDAMAAHGGPERRRDVMQDTAVGVGAVLAVALGVVGLAFAGVALARGGLTALALVVAAEVGAKLGMAGLACLGTASHEGLAAKLTDELRGRDLVLPALVATPALLLPGAVADRIGGVVWETALGPVGWPVPAVVVTLVAALVGTALVGAWADRVLGGVSGDVLGATNETARLIGLHAGVLVWTLW